MVECKADDGGKASEQLSKTQSTRHIVGILIAVFDSVVKL